MQCGMSQPTNRNPTMKQAISFQGAVAGLSTRADKSLTVRLETPSLTSEEKMLVMELQDIPCNVSFEPLEGYEVTKEIKTDLSRKTQSERIRAVLFVYWSQLGEPGEFSAFYETETEKYINAVKMRLKPV